MIGSFFRFVLYGTEENTGGKGCYGEACECSIGAHRAGTDPAAFAPLTDRRGTDE